MPLQFERPVESRKQLRSFLHEAGKLRTFVPPFRFSAFFSPEDTLLCACASEAALAHARAGRPGGWPTRPMNIVELTTGSGLVGLHLLLLDTRSRLIGMDVDPAATSTAARNAKLLGLSRRARFECADLWSSTTTTLLKEHSPAVLVCNPPYVAEPLGGRLEIEAGAGADGTAHIERTIEVADEVRPRSLALSWCSLSNPGKVVRLAEAAGYWLRSLFCVVIADGEYSGSVHTYLRSLDHCYINESEEAVNAVAPDGSGRFAFVLMAGNFSSSGTPLIRRGEAGDTVERMCENFSSSGLDAFDNSGARIPIRSWILDRWDEVRLRAFLHGTPDNKGMSA